MSIISRMRKQRAAYWAPASLDTYGNPVHGSPVEIRCRWEDKQERKLNGEGEEILTASTVYVDRVLAIHGFLVLLDDSGMPSGFDPDPVVHGAREIQVFESLPNLRNTEKLYTVYL